MLTPQQLTELVETLYPSLDNLNQWITQDMIKRLMARLGRGADAVLSATDQWQAEVYQTAGGHLEDLQKELQKFTKQSDAEIAAIFEDAAVKAWAADCAVYVANDKAVQPLALSERMVQILQDAYTRTQGEAHNFTRTTANASQQRLFKVLDEAHFKVITGAQSYTAAVQEAVDDLVQHQTHVVYPTGHRDTIETAVLRAVRTGISQATGNMTLQGMMDLDWDIILVSAHRGARYGDGGHNPGNHYWWQGKYYSRTGRTADLPLFAESTGFGTGEGLGGYNCRHSFGPGDLNHNPYQHFDEDENKRVYDLTQKQRAKEARIRREKVEMAGYRTAAQNATDGELRAVLEDKATRAEVRLQKHTQDYEQFCAENDLKPLNDRLYVARRSQADASKAAYEPPVLQKLNETATESPEMNRKEGGKFDSTITPEERVKIENELSALPEWQRNLAETKISHIEVTDSMVGSGWNLNTHNVRLSAYREAGTVIHEYGHALAEALDLENNQTFIEVRNSGIDLEDPSKVVYDETTYSKPIMRLECDKFVSEYQGRLYEFIGFYDGEKLDLRAMQEYFSEGYKAFYTEPELLQKKDPKLYAFIGGLTNDEK